MTYFYERNITEIKNEYTTFLINIITPFIYEGIRSVYQFSVNAHSEFVERGKYDNEIKSPGILKLFQLSLKEIPTLNNNEMEIETNRIKMGSKCADWFDDLVRAVIKSNIILLIFKDPKKKSELLSEEYHNKVQIKDFIHQCYIESARLIYDNPELFGHEYPPLEIKRNQRETCQLIKESIHQAIRQILPAKKMINEFLENNYIDMDESDISRKISDGKYINIKSMVERDLHGGRPSVLEDEEEEDNDDETDYYDNSESSNTQTINNETNDDEMNAFMDSIKCKIPEGKKDDDMVVAQVEVQNEVVENLKIETAPISKEEEIKEEEIKGGNELPVLPDIPVVKPDPLERAKKPTKRDQIFLKEIEDQKKPKVEEPDKKLFFEQYMK
jgi:hypothetical protein